MIRSMTGYGRGEFSSPECKVTAELKSVNHRYLDLGLKLPKKLYIFEASIRGLLKNYMQRGKVDLFVTFEDFRENQTVLRYNGALAGEYVHYISQMAEAFGLPDDLTAVKLAQMPEVLTMEQAAEDEGETWKELSAALTQAAESFVASREAEGERLRSDLMQKLENLAGMVSDIEGRYPQALAAYRARLKERLDEVMTNTSIEEQVVAAEMVIYADKTCTDEETVRLKSHIEAMRGALLEGENVGRRLDFIAQEMNREANTIGSKAGDLGITQIVVDIKADIEKIREQIQNIE
ncbi:MAG: YicC family protein [Lachnospiraceae bacterium]|jgi:uncharacterized protein (TIGR00255 family)|nr:YicC family protein [Lachnospiraceae bacterium]